MKTNRLKNDENYYLKENESGSEEEKKENNVNKVINNIIEEEVDIENIKVNDIDEDRIENNLEDEDHEDIIEVSSIKNEKITEVKIGKISDKIRTIESTNIEEKDFREEDGINRALKDLEEEKRKRDSNIPQKLDLWNPKNVIILRI